MINFFCICLFVITWFFIPVKGVIDQFRIPKEMIFDLMCLGMIFFAIKDGLKFNYRNKWLSFFVLWVFITIAFNWYFPSTFFKGLGQPINIGTLMPTIHFILGVVLTIICLASFKEEDYKKIIKVLCLNSILISAWCLLQHFGFDPFGKISTYNHPNKMTACLDNPNLVGSYVALCIPFFFVLKKWQAIPGIIISLFVIYLSKSSMGMITAIVGLSVFVLLKYIEHWKITVPSILIVGLVCLFILGAFNDQILKQYTYGRIDCWKIALRHLKDNPLFGQGLGIWKSWDVRIDTSVWTYVHNDWLERALEIGLIGVFLMVVVAINSILKFNYQSNDYINFSFLAVFVSFLVLMFGTFSVEIAPLSLIGLISFWGVEKS